MRIVATGSNGPMGSELQRCTQRATSLRQQSGHEVDQDDD